MLFTKPRKNYSQKDYCMISIGQDIHLKRPIGSYLPRSYVVFNYPKTAKREVAIMLLLQSKPMYTQDIAKAIGDSYYSVAESLTILRKDHLIRKECRWYLEEM